MANLWQLFIFYSLIATIGHTTIGSFSGTAVLAPWFPKSKGVMLGLADSGNPAGQAVVTPLAQYVITNYGLRAGFQTVGILFFLMTAPLNFLLQRNPPRSESGTNATDLPEKSVEVISLEPTTEPDSVGCRPGAHRSAPPR